MADAPPVPQEESPLERVRRRLYSRNPEAAEARAREANGTAPLPPHGWNEDPAGKRKLPFSAIFLMAAAGFFLIAGIAALTILLMGGRSVSSDRITVTVEGPAQVAGGEVAPFFIVVKNRNPVAATGVSLSIEFPEGAYSADDPTLALTHYDVKLDDIPAGESVRESVRAIFYGAENDQVLIPLRVEYRTENSSATFVKDEEYRLTISSSPLSVRITTLDEVASGQPITLVASVRSNAPDTLKNVGVETTLPFGFTLADASPTPSGNLFSLGTLRPGEEREIRVTGTMIGQDGDERVFTFSAGVLPAEGAWALSKPYYTVAQAPVRITKSFLGVALTLNGSREDTVSIPAGEDLAATLAWTNTLPTSIADGKITVALSGDAFELSSVSATNGFYRSSDRTVTFSRDTDAGLANLAPGDTGNGSIRLKLKDAAALEDVRDPSVTLTISVAGRRIGDGNVAENLSSTVTRTVRVATGVSVSADIVRTLGDFENMGPWPPEPDAETTYTVRLVTASSLNAVAGTKVTMKLPPNVRYTGIASAGDSFAFDAQTRLITWAVGDLLAGSSQEAAFQIGFTPTAAQSGREPDLVTDIIVSGTDRFTQTPVSAGGERLTTDTPNDPGSPPDSARVK